MNLFTLFYSKSKTFYLLLIFLGLVRSVTNIGILMLINTALGGKPIPIAGHYGHVAYVLLILLSFTCTMLFQNYMVRFNNDIMFEMELSLVEKVRNAPFESFEKMGSQKIYAALGDARLLARVPEVFIGLMNATIAIICSLSYLCWISLWSGIIVMLVMGLLLVVYMYRDRRIAKDMNAIRDLQDHYYDALRELLLGFRQVRISRKRNDNLFNGYILSNRRKSRDLNVQVAMRYLLNELTGTYSWYVLLGIIIFLLPLLFSMNIAGIAAFTTSVLFMMAPVTQLVMFFPVYNSFKIAVERINGISRQLERFGSMPEKRHDAPWEFGQLRFEDIVYRYNEDDPQSFVVSMPEFTVNKGDIIFIVGGNGSGKTTFINLLTGLYRPQRGKVFVDDREITWDEFYTYSDQMAVVFSDHHLFSNNYDGHDLSEENPELTHYRNLLNLEGILRIEKELNRADIRLSKGQQKRLALLLAMMEQKPLLILDEWAAEQDPGNRRYFYTCLLDTLKNMGKTIIAISHDDDFYYTASRVVKFNYGKIVSDENVAADIT